MSWARVSASNDADDIGDHRRRRRRPLEQTTGRLDGALALDWISGSSNCGGRDLLIPRLIKSMAGIGSLLSVMTLHTMSQKQFFLAKKKDAWMLNV